MMLIKDYNPFGMLQPDRHFNASDYRFGYNGKENDNEIKGIGNQQNYGMRLYDPRLAKFLSVDPISSKYPWYSPYQFAGNKPTIATDLDGLEENVIIRWYDPLNPEQWVGSTGLKVSNQNDRVLGQTGILFLTLDKTPVNEDLALRLASASTTPRNARNNHVFSTIMHNSGIIQNGVIISNNASYQSSSTSINEMENNIIAIAEKKINNGFRGLGAGYPPKLFIGFEKDKSTFNAELDIDNNGINNQKEFDASVLYLKQNPTVSATIVGDASSETITRSNTDLANDRSETVKSKLISSGIESNKVSGEGNFSNNPVENVPTDRSAKINFNIPR
jgi:RHS repeat-associated protein